MSSETMQWVFKTIGEELAERELPGISDKIKNSDFEALIDELEQKNYFENFKIEKCVEILKTFRYS